MTAQSSWRLTQEAIREENNGSRVACAELKSDYKKLNNMLFGRCYETSRRKVRKTAQPTLPLWDTCTRNSDSGRYWMSTQGRRGNKQQKMPVTMLHRGTVASLLHCQCSTGRLMNILIILWSVPIHTACQWWSLLDAMWFHTDKKSHIRSDFSSSIHCTCHWWVFLYYASV